MKKIILTLLILSCIVIVINLIFVSNKKISLPSFSPTPTPVGNPAARFNAIDYSKIFANPSVEQQVKDVLKNPTGAEAQNGVTVVSFPTDITTRPNLVYETGGVAQYVSQEVTTDNSYLSSFTTSHPTSQSFILYDAGAETAGFTWYIFPTDGVAYLANKDNDGYTIRVLYFQPTTKGDFIKKDAPVFNMLQTNPNTPDLPESFTE